MIVPALAFWVLTAQFFQRENAADAEDGLGSLWSEVGVAHETPAMGSRFSTRLPAFLHWNCPHIAMYL